MHAIHDPAAVWKGCIDDCVAWKERRIKSYYHVGMISRVRRVISLWRLIHRRWWSYSVLGAYRHSLHNPTQIFLWFFFVSERFSCSGLRSVFPLFRFETAYSTQSPSREFQNMAYEGESAKAEEKIQSRGFFGWYEIIPVWDSILNTESFTGISGHGIRSVKVQKPARKDSIERILWLIWKHPAIMNSIC